MVIESAPPSMFRQFVTRNTRPRRDPLDIRRGHHEAMMRSRSANPRAPLGDITNGVQADLPVKRRSLAPGDPASTALLDGPVWPRVEYSTDFMLNMLDAERKHRQPSADYMRHQNVVHEGMRSVLIDWLVDVHATYELRIETLFLTISIIDQYLAQVKVSRRELQLIGVASMFIASKFEEIHPPEAKDFVYITAKSYSKQEIFDMELRILSQLQFKVARPTVAHFLQRLEAEASRASKPDSPRERVMQHLPWYLVELCMLDVGTLQFMPSCVAVAALTLTRRLLNVNAAGPHQCMDLVGQTLAVEVLEECMNFMLNLLEAAPSTATTAAVRRKHSDQISVLGAPQEETEQAVAI
mmetsp:Transcript_14337/g.26333  ORF Transcript_14337/g.26333 Transcript_14337/m.26333 type:complete len:354 (-) Transcript_14337:315-1376(-)